MWKWDRRKLGSLAFDKDRKLVFDGSVFMCREKDPNNPEQFIYHSISLENWLIAAALERDPDAFAGENGSKWRNRTLWHEFLRVTQVLI